MKKWLHKVEVFVDKAIPWLVLLLLFVIIADIFFRHEVEPYEIYLKMIDWIIIGFFVVDLIFKYIRIRKIPKFLRTCWLDILVVFPFFLIFRMVEVFVSAVRVSDTLASVQKVLHEGLEIEKEGVKIIEETAKIAREAEMAGKASRTRVIFRMFRPLQRSPRLLKIVPFFEHPTGKHHLHETPAHGPYQKVKAVHKRSIKKKAR